MSRKSKLPLETKTLAGRLRTLREHASLEQSEVAEAVGVARPSVSEWENGKKAPSRESLRALAMYYRVSLDWLAEGGDEMILVESPEDQEMLRLIQGAPSHIRQAVLTLLQANAPQNGDNPAPHEVARPVATQKRAK